MSPLALFITMLFSIKNTARRLAFQMPSMLLISFVDEFINICRTTEKPSQIFKSANGVNSRKFRGGRVSFRI